MVTDAGWSEEDMSLERRGGEGLPGTDTVLTSITYFIRTLTISNSQVSCSRCSQLCTYVCTYIRMCVST